MRVIAGEKGGRRLIAPAGRGTRPTGDRVREAAFSMLESAGALAGARVWDLFAGSGALGIEALSRGAARATFVDQARARRVRRPGQPGQAGLRARQGRGWSAGTPSPGPRPEGLEHSWGEADAGETLEEVDLVLADPPYAWQEWARAAERAGPLFASLAYGDGRRAGVAPGLAGAAVQALRGYPRYIGSFAR